MRGRHGYAADGMAEERQGNTVEQDAGVRVSGLDVRGRTIVFASHQTNLAVR